MGFLSPQAGDRLPLRKTSKPKLSKSHLKITGKINGQVSRL